MARTPFDALDALEAMLHLDDEEVALLATAAQGCDEQARHAEECPRCARRVERARSLLQVEPFRRRAEPSRVSSLLDRLAAVGAVAPAPEQRALIRVAFADEALHVLQTDTEVRITPQVAVRGVDPVGAPRGVTFFRQLGAIPLEVHLVRVPGDTFHLVVGLGDEAPEGRFQIVLRRGHRELAVRPVVGAVATFKSLRPAAYRLELQDAGAPVGFVDVDVEASRPAEEGR